MPTPVSTARQCLTSEAALALDEAVSVARRRSHPQTTSLHALFALLSLPSSSALRDACSRARNSAYSPRLQLRALDLCFSAALDRLPSSSTSSSSSDEHHQPPISNSLMAAIKRSQANQRRHPDTFHFYQQQQLSNQLSQPSQSSSSSSSSSSSISCVKVELQQLILSILDDPVVSRVFGEAGFRSCDVKLAIIRPPVMRLQRSRRPPLFLCNFVGGDESSEQGVYRRSFSFPFAGVSSGISGSGIGSDAGENCRRVGEVLARKKERNPLLVGGFAGDAVRSFAVAVESGGGGVLPAEIAGLRFVSIEYEVSEYVSSGSELLLRSRFDEVNRMVESCGGAGVVVSFGDLKVLVGDNGGGCVVVDHVSYVVSQLTKLLERNRPKLWLIGATASYELYLKFLKRFASIEKDWDLQLLPITSSIRSPLSSIDGGLPSRPHSLMESFVPFGGFFSSPSDFKEPFSSSGSPCQSVSCCSACNDKCKQEISTILNGGCSLSVTDQYQESVPPWLQMAEVNANSILNVAKAKDDGTALNAKIAGLQRKWSDICRRLDHRSPVSDAGSFQVRAPMFPGIAGFPFAVERKDKVDNHSSSSVNATIKGNACENVFPIMSTGLQKFPLMDQRIQKPVVSESKSDNIASELEGRLSKDEGLRMRGYWFPECSISHLTNPSHNTSPSSPASVATDLGLGTIYASSIEELNKPTFQAHKERLKDISGCLPSKVDLVNSVISNPSIRSSSCSAPDLSGQDEPKDYKALYKCLLEKVGRQHEAIRVISQTIAWCRTGNERRRGSSMRRDIWFSFIGSDRVAKKKIAVALAEIIFGSRHNLICVDFCSRDGSTHPNTIFDCHEISGYDVKYRGKTVVDIIAEEITKKPPSVVFLENIDKADLLAQNSLIQAIKTGKFQDTHGREISINNSIFVTTARGLKDKESPSFRKDLAKFTEERVLEAQRLEMQILINCIPEVNAVGNNTKVTVTSRKNSSDPALVNKRKRMGSYDIEGQDEKLEPVERAPKTSKCLDLNLPIEEMEQEGSDSKSSDSEPVSENSQLWLEDFLDQMNKTLFFKPFDFDALANKILIEISDVLAKTVCSGVLLEIDSKVMEQILAAAWMSNGSRAIKDWVEHVLGGCLTEAHKRYSLNARTLLTLLNCEGTCMQDQAPGVCLPARVVLN